MQQNEVLEWTAALQTVGGGYHVLLLSPIKKLLAVRKLAHQEEYGRLKPLSTVFFFNLQGVFFFHSELLENVICCIPLV